MCQPDNSEWLLARIEAAKKEIIAIEDKIFALSNGPLKYNLNTGQTQTSVEQQQLDQFRLMLSSAENRLSTLECRLYGSGAIHVRPAF